MSDDSNGAPKLISKEELELEKLRLEIRFARRGFALQLANFVTLICIALLVFYFFQRPQVQTMEAARVATEKHQVAQLVIAAQAISGEAERIRVLDMLAEQYPHFPFVIRIARSVRPITEANAQASDQQDQRTRPQSSTQFASSRDDLRRAEIDRLTTDCSGSSIMRAFLSSQLHDLKDQLESERSRAISTAGDAATISAIQIAIANLESRIRVSAASNQNDRCSESIREIHEMRELSPLPAPNPKPFPAPIPGPLPTPDQIPPAVGLE